VAVLDRPKQIYRFAEADDRSDYAAAPAINAPTRPKPKPLHIWRGTEISNPFRSSEESANHRSPAFATDHPEGKGDLVRRPMPA